MTLLASPGTSRIWLTPVSLIRVAALLAVSAISPSPMQAQQSVLVPAGALWKYLDTGADQGTAWRTPAFNDSGWRAGQFPVAERLAKELLCLPMRPDLTLEETDYVCARIQDFFVSLSSKTTVASKPVKRASRDR